MKIVKKLKRNLTSQYKSIIKKIMNQLSKKTILEKFNKLEMK